MLKVENVSFAYDISPVLRNIDFNLLKGEYLSVIGASGCGKSTLLKIIYGLLHSSGKVFWNGKELLGPDFNLVPGEEFIKYLAQDFDLMLPVSVEENVGKHLSNAFPIKKKKRIKELLEIVELTDVAKEKTKNLSGGQQQRVALARALALEPELLLLDEPFSHIDHFRKNNLRRRLFEYLKKQEITCIIATHDSTDALSFADKTMVLKDGKIHAFNDPRVLYKNPPDFYTASLFGDVNEISLKNIIASEEGKERIILYPHELKTVERSDSMATVIKSYFKGEKYLIKADLKGEVVLFDHPSALPEGKIIFLKFRLKWRF